MHRTTKTLLGFILLLIIPALACETNRPADPNDFTDHDLSHEDFSFQNISGYDLSDRNFQEAIFAYAEVYNTDFSHADLRGADFSSAFFEDVDFSNADLRDVGLSYASTRFNSKVNFQGADLRGAKLDFACLDADWTDAQLDEKWRQVFQLCEFFGYTFVWHKLSGSCCNTRTTRTSFVFVYSNARWNDS